MSAANSRPSSPALFGTLDIASRRYSYVNLRKVLPAEQLAALPRSLKILSENVARRSPGAVPALLAWIADRRKQQDVPFYPGRVLMHDTTCSPALADLAAMRDAVARSGGDPAAISPTIPVDLVIDHSVMADEYGHNGAVARNLEREFARNEERYQFIKWAQQSLANFRVVPPGNGILHQVNIEYLAEVVKVMPGEPLPLLVPDTLLGTDSHTPMINALGIIAWGVGGLEAQAAMLGEPVSVVLPRVVGVRLARELRPGITATDLVLHLTKVFRNHGVVDKFIEFYGPGLVALSIGDRATVSNMAPEYGSTCSYFPIDALTLAYLESTGRSAEHLARIEAYARAQTLWCDNASADPQFDELIEVDLGRIEPTMSGPRQPHQQQSLSRVWQSFCDEFPVEKRAADEYHDGIVALAAITSCTNTSNPALMVGAGLLARNARRRGLTRKPWVKTSLSPGSRVVSDYLSASGLQHDLDALGFNVVGYGCMTCIGNSGNLEPDVIEAVEKQGLRAVGVISGNRNFDGRVNPHLAAAYLASPALVVAAAIAGTVNLDFSRDAIGTDRNGIPVRLADIWPMRDEIERVVSENIHQDQYAKRYQDIWTGSDEWRAIDAPGTATFPWDADSNYIRRPPYADPQEHNIAAKVALQGMRPFLMLGDNVTTDHISPAGRIPPNSVAGRYLHSRGVRVADFNQYSTRRTNHEVMMRGAFSNPKLVNELVNSHGKASAGCLAWSSTRDRALSPYEAALTYGSTVPLVIVAGKNYGAGSSRDWAAKAPALLGIKAIIAESYERIHRSNLIGMGIYPLQFVNGVTRRDICRDGREVIDVELGELSVGKNAVAMHIHQEDGNTRCFEVLCRIDSAQELAYLAHRGVLRYIVQKTLYRNTPSGI